MKAVILAGGLGTRLIEVVQDRPKPMALIAGKPFLEHQLYFLKDRGIEEIILAVHYMAGHIKSYFGTGHRFGVEITYSEEENPLGTAGAIKKAEKYLDDTFLALNGDTFSQVDLKKFLEFHQAKRSNFSLGLAKLDSEESVHYGSVVMDGNKIVNFSEKEEKETKDKIINRGVYIFEPQIFESIEPERNISLEKEVFPELARKGKLYGCLCDGYFMDMGRPETYEKLKKYFLESLLLKKNLSVREAMHEIDKNRTDLLLVVDEERKLCGVLNDKIIKRFMYKGGSLEVKVEEAMETPEEVVNVKDSDEKVHEILLSGVNRLPVLDEEGRVQDVKFRVEEIKSEVFPILRGKSPLRVSFAGGGTDVLYFFQKYGGVVTSATIDKYCHATLAKRADSKIVINSDLGKEIIIDSKKIEYDGEFDLVKAIIKLMKPDFGFELYLHNDLPPGRGLGSSASLSVLVASLLSQLQNTNYDDYKIVEIAHDAECKELGIKGGWQDQYAAVTGGFNFMEFFGDKRPVIYPLRLKEEIIHELNEHLSLCYVGKQHFSGDLHESQEKNFRKNEEAAVKELNKLKETAISIKDYILRGELEKIGGLLHESWEIKRKMSEGMSNPQIDEIYSVGMKNGAYGGKLLGAGGGGYILFFHSPKKRNQLKRAVEESGGETTNFNFEFQGTRLWPVKNKY